MKRDYQFRAKLTLYNGIVFRSQLEARWAVFFDSLGVEYNYEPHSYEVRTGGRYVQYMPDFFLPGLCPLEGNLKGSVARQGYIWGPGEGLHKRVGWLKEKLCKLG